MENIVNPFAVGRWSYDDFLKNLFKAISTQRTKVGNSTGLLWGFMLVFTFSSHGQNLDFQFGEQGFDPGQYRNPIGIEIDANDDIYVVDQGRNALMKFDATGNLIFDIILFSPGNGQGIMAIADMAMDSAGNLYITHHRFHKVYKYAPDGSLIMEFGSEGTGNGEFDTPRGITIDQNDNVYVVDHNNHRVQVFDVDGNYLSQFGSEGTEPDQFQRPFSIAVDPSGDIYVLDSFIDVVVKKFNNDGEFLFQFGSKGTDNGQFSGPGKIIPDNEGNIYVTNGNTRDAIQKLDASGRYLSRIHRSDEFTATFGITTDLAFDSKGDIYISSKVPNIEKYTFDLVPEFARIRGDNQVILTFSEPVETNNSNPGDFMITDGRGMNFPVTDQNQGVEGDADITLVVPGITTAAGDLTVTYTNNNNEVRAFQGTVFARSREVNLDNDHTPPELIEASVKSLNQIRLVFDEPVQLLPDGFALFNLLDVRSHIEVELLSVEDGQPGDNELILVTEPLASIVYPFSLFYNGNQITDFGGNALEKLDERLPIDKTPIITGAVKENNTEITVTFNSNVGLNGLNAADFSLSDSNASNYAITGVADGTAADDRITLTVASIANAVGDLTLTYANNNDGIHDTDTPALIVPSEPDGVMVDCGTPELVSATKDSNTQITLTFNEAVQAPTLNTSAFQLVDIAGTVFTVTAISDPVPGDNQLTLTTSSTASFSSHIRITYQNLNNGLTDLQGNAMKDDPLGVGIYQSGAFVFTWEIKDASLTVHIPTGAGNPYNYTVDWGDGTVDQNQTKRALKTYANPGIYTVTITGTFPRIDFSEIRTTSADAFVLETMLSIDQWGDNSWTSMDGAFTRCRNLEIKATDAPDLSGVTNMNSMFFGTSVNSDLNHWNVSHVTHMGSLFAGARQFTGGVSSWDVSNVVSMTNMFNGTQIDDDLSGWNVSKVTNMGGMFAGTAFFNSDISGWDVSNVTRMGSMFARAQKFNQDISGWNVSKVTDMGSMFADTKVFNQPIGSWDIGAVRSIANMFAGAQAFNQPIGSWNMQSVTSTFGMFANTLVFNQDISGWNMSNVQSMGSMFAGSKAFNQPIGNWNTAKVISTEHMFDGAEAFDQPIDGWNMEKVQFTRFMFRDTKVFNQDVSAWELNSAKYMNNMFEGSQAFNQDISDWQLPANDIDMSYFFKDAAAFDQNLSELDVSNVTDMESMFENAAVFDQSLAGWDISSVRYMDHMLDNSPVSQENYDATLFAWSQLPNLQRAQDITLGAEGLSFCESATARQSLIDNNSWTIVDDGQSCGLIMIDARVESDTEISAVFSEPVHTNGGNPTDFTVTDGFGQTYEVTAQSDGIAGDEIVQLIVEDLGQAIGDLFVSYTNNHDEILDFNSLASTAASNRVPILIDLDDTAPELERGFRESDFEIILVFTERIQALLENREDFMVRDENGVIFPVWRITDETPGDNRISLRVSLHNAVGKVTVTYVDNNQEIADFGQNVLASDPIGVELEPELKILSANLDSNTQITLSFNATVLTTGANPEDFIVQDETGTVFDVSAQNDGTAGDQELVLTVADVGTATGFLRITYKDNNQAVTNAMNSPLATNLKGVFIDIQAPDMVGIEKWSPTTMYVYFSEKVKTNEGNPTDFVVMDGTGANFVVSAQQDIFAEDSIIVLTIPNLPDAQGDITVSYTNNNDEISDLSGLILESVSPGFTLESEPFFTSQPITTAKEGDDYRYEITHHDRNGDPLTVTASVKPAWLNLNTELVVTTFAGGGERGIADGSGAAAEFHHPRTLVIDDCGNMYVGESNNRIRRISPTGEVSFLAGSVNGRSWGSTNGSHGTDRRATLFASPRNMQMASDGSIYLVTNGDYIKKLTPDGSMIHIAGNYGGGDIDGTGTEARFSTIGGMAIDKDDNLYTNSGANGLATLIRKITPEGVVTTIAGSVRGFQDGPAFSAQFENMGGMAVDSQGNIYIADTGNQRIRKLSPAGMVSTFAGSGVRGISDGVGTNAEFSSPFGMTIDAMDNLYVSDFGSHLIRKITPAGVVTTIAGSGEEGHEDGPALEASLERAYGMDIDKQGNLFITQSSLVGGFFGREDYHAIRKIGNVYVLEGNTAGQVGSHAVTLDLTDGNGGTDSQIFNIEVTDAVPPVFTSTAAVSIEENETGVVYIAVATDQTPVTYSLASGNDNNRFDIDGTTGEVTFKTPPDFEMPSDANGDNDYIIEITASDGTNESMLLVTITVTDKTDEIYPTVTLTAAGVSPVGGVHTVTAQFSEDVTGFDVSDITISGGTINNFAAVNASTYTFDVTSGVGAADVDIAAGVAQDLANNDNEAAVTLNLIFDTTPPDVVLSTTANDPNSGAFDITATFTEDVMNLATTDFTVTNGSATAVAGSGAVYTITITPAADGTVTVNLPANTVQDLANNDNTASNTITLENDETAPTITISSIASDPTAGAFDITMTFSEAVTGFDITDLVIGNGVAGNFAGSGTSYTATITPSSDGTVTVDIATGAGQDDATNGNTAATQFSIENDQTSPSLIISTSVGDPTSGAFMTIFTFDEDVTGFDIGDISIGNGSVSGLSGSGALYTATVTPAADGTVTIDVAGAIAQDAAGNDNTAAAQFIIENDETAPAVTITSAANDPVNGALDITLTFSEDITGLILTDLVVSNGSASNLSGSGSIYTATITPASDGTLTIDIATGAAQDAAGNDNTAATQFSIQADLTAPASPAISGISDDTGSDASDQVTNDNTLIFTGTAEANSTVELFIDGVSAGTTTVDGSGNWTYDHSATVLADADYDVTATATDAAMNTSALSAILIVTVDTVTPVDPVLSTISDDNGISNTDIITNDPTLVFAGTAEPFAAIAIGSGPFTLVTTTADANGDWIADATFRSFTTSLNLFVTATDLAGNTSSNSNTFFIGIDTVLPTVQSIVRADPNPTTVSSVDFTVTFSENVYGLTTSNFSLDFTATQDADIASISASSGTTFTVTVNNITGSGTFGLNLTDLTGVMDEAGNGLGGTFTGEVYNTNFFPTDITLSASSILENNAIGDVVAVLSTTDADVADTHSYSFVAGAGGIDNASFTIVGNELRAAESFDLETKATYFIELRTDDGRGGTFDKTFTITIDNVPEADLRITGNNDIPATPLGITTTFDVTIHNDGDAALNVTSVLYPTAFGGPVSGITVAPASSQVVTMTFTPTVAQLYTGDITINTNGGTGILSVSADGAIITSVDDGLLKAESINLYPNPASDIVTIDLSKYNGRALDIGLYDMSGMKTFGVNDYKEASLKLDISGYHNGLYLVQFTDGKSTVQKKIMIRK